MPENSLNHELNNLRQRGLVLPRHPERAMVSYGESVKTSQQLNKAAGADLDRASMRLGRPITSANYDSPEVQKIMSENNALTRAMGDKRSNSRRIASGGGPDVYNAVPRFYDPLEYWDLSGLPWNVADEGHRHKLHKWLRLYYATHYLVPILIDIFTRFPLVGMELKHKDPQIQSVYEDMFIDQLDYPEFLVTLGREHWLVGEAFSLGSFDEDLRIWEREELINPEDVTIDNFPMLGSQQLKIVPPDYLKRLAQLKSPAKEYRLLELNFPELIPYLLRGDHIPISPVLLKQIGNKLNHWDDHGTPILLRGLRTLLHEEKLLASQDAIAERLYSPLILAKLGIQDMGDGLPPFLPGPEELDSVRDDFDIALSSDFRLMVHHFGLEVTSVFGREQMPRLGDDFDRVERRLMQVFGVNPSLLSAGSNSQPYASSALQAEFMNQMLRTFQNTLKKHFRDRAMVVAEAQEHYDYEVKGHTRIPIYETIVEYDLEGNKTFREVPKLTIPDMSFACLAYGTRVYTPDGPIATEALQTGDCVVSWDQDNNIATESYITHSYDNGIKPIYRIKTKLGRSIDVTEEHPFLTPMGWVAAEKLIVEEKVQVGTSYIPESPPTITERDAHFLGLMIGDGCASCFSRGAVPSFANIDREILDWTDHYVSGYGCSLKICDDGVSHNITQTHDRRVNPNPLKAFLTQHGYADKTAWEKRVPNSVWAGGPGIWAAFLSGYLDADGTVATDKAISWTMVNKELAMDVQMLAAYLGMRAQTCYYERWRTSDPPGSKDNKPVLFKWWMVNISSRASLERAQRLFEPKAYRKQNMCSRVMVVDERRTLTPEQADEVKKTVAKKRSRNDGPTYKEVGSKYNVSASTVLRAVQGEYDELFKSYVDPRWDDIVSIEQLPAAPTWSLGIKDTFTHITEGLVTHNTFDLRDEATERQFLQSLRQLGVPIPDEDLMVGVSWDIKDKIGTYNRELKEKTISQQQAKMDTYTALVAKGLPVPLDLKTEVESVLQAGAPGGMPGGPGGMSGGPGGMPGGPGGGEMGGPGASSAGDIVMPEPPPGLGGGPGTVPPGGGPPPTSPQEAGPPGNVPQVSNERRPGLTYNTNRNRVARKEASAIDEFMNRYDDLGVPFEDFVADHNRLGYTNAYLDDIPYEEIERLWEFWPEYQQEYREGVASEITSKMVELSNDAEDDILEEESEKELEHYQTLSTDDKGNQIILEKRANKRVVTQLPLDKKYSIVDPEA